MPQSTKFYDEKWKEHCSQIVVAANQAKFSQNPELAKYLFPIRAARTRRASLWDRIWGIGMAKIKYKSPRPQTMEGSKLARLCLDGSARSVRQII